MRSKLRTTISAVILMLALNVAASAACTCECIEGEAKNICEYSYEYKQPCYKTCPPVTPAIKPIPQPAIPPVGMSKCEDRQVMNAQTKRYEWRKVCE